MSRLLIPSQDKAQMVVESLYQDLERRIIASPPGLCPVDMTESFLKLSHAQSCGKCVPCRVGLGQLQKLLHDVLEEKASVETIDVIEETAQAIVESADCAIGFEAARMVLHGLEGFREDYIAHVTGGSCMANLEQPVPCVSMCPAHVDIPGYIALVEAGRYADAVRLIRKDNPFPSACGLICEHPCEARCRRNMMDDAINIRGMKRFACEKAGYVPAPTPTEKTGKKVAIIGSGPAGLSAAYYLSIMGHDVVVYEKQQRLGGMLRYGIPSYRLPREFLDAEIDVILSTGVEVKRGVDVGTDITIDQLQKEYDSVFVAIGAHDHKTLNIEGEDLENVTNAVKFLHDIGDEVFPDLKGKKVAVIGGGNVAMDVCRSSIRLGADQVYCIYRRRVEDMTALKEEIEGAIAEGVEILSLQAPSRIEGKDGKVSALWVQPQIVGAMRGGRPSPKNATCPEERIECDIVIVAIGQAIGITSFEAAGLPVKHNTFAATDTLAFKDLPGVFAGGDCTTGPATVIRAIAAGKVAAANIDEYLGFYHEITSGVDVPEPLHIDRRPCGRVNMKERKAYDRKDDMLPMELNMSDEEAKQESRRCLRCDFYGYGVLKGGRNRSW